MTKGLSGMTSLAQQGILLPQESVLEVGKLRQDLFIGIPKEISFQEKRIPLVPEAVAVLVNQGHRILIETGAGTSANFTDSDYSEAGAQIAYSPEDVYKADIILKVAPPSLKELEYFKDKQFLMSILQIGMQQEGYVQRLSSKKVTALAYEYLKDETSVYPVIQAMSEIVGGAAILIASELLSNTTGGKGELLGGVPGIPPTEVVIIGAGTVSEYAARAAMGLGANVRIFDTSVYKLRRIQRNLGSRVYTSTINPTVLLKALKTCDVAIGAILSKEGRSPVIVTEEMVSEMSFGSVIIDVSIDQGGCFETSEVTNHSEPTFKKYGVTHYCVPNIASRVSRTASYALSNIFTPILINMGEEGGMDALLWKDAHVRSAAYLYRGTVTNRFVADYCKLPFRDLNLLMAARI
ncbi:MAG: alanine dehydrogenase [Bacteroidia bacterium]|nr:alanine dehydrogenase [Bacteroidia bacterium]